MSVNPHIAVICDCGATGEAEAGEAWRCAACGRLWRIAEPPAEQVAAMIRITRQHRLRTRLSLLAVSMVCAVPALVGDRVALALVAPAALAAWAVAVLPHLRRRYREAVRALPAWTVFHQTRS